MSNQDVLDEVKLAEYLSQHIEGFKGPLTASKFPGGQSNPTFQIEAASGKYVLRRKPAGKLLPSAHAVDREFMAMDALKDSDVPVAKAYHLCEDDSVIGSMFYVMEFIEGRIFWNAALPELNNTQRTDIYDEMNRVLAAMHSVDINEVGLSDFGKPGNYYQRQISRWSKQYLAAKTDDIPAMDGLMEWLENNIPEDDGRVGLAHGDFRLDNFIFHPSESKILAVVDWELSTLGHPFADLAYQCMQWYFPATSDMPGLMGLDRTALGIPTEEEYVAKYCERMGLTEIPNWNFYLAFSFFRLASICQGVKKRALDGNASNKKALKVGGLVIPLAEMGLGKAKQASAVSA
jgi:aminoglycoside phosphotransferase (APT) family kinase protein